MKKLVVLSALAASVCFGTNAMADREHSMHHVYQHHYGKMHKGAHYGHRQACIGLSAGTAHHSCGTHTGGPSGSLH